MAREKNYILSKWPYYTTIRHLSQMHI